MSNCGAGCWSDTGAAAPWSAATVTGAIEPREGESSRFDSPERESMALIEDVAKPGLRAAQRDRADGGVSSIILQHV